VPAPGRAASVERSAREGGRVTGTTASIRGSSGMLVGYAVAQVVNFVVQVGIVRHLDKDVYGAFAWALSAVLLLHSLVPLGLDRANTRFLAMYDERRDYPRLFGMVALEGLVLLVTGGCVVLGALALRPAIRDVAPSSLAVSLLLILVALAPIEALDVIVVDMFAVFSRPWSVFARRYLLQPFGRLLVVALMIVFDRGVVFLAVGFLAVSTLGLVLFAFLLRRLFRQVGLAEHFSWRTIRLPVREVAVFCGPVLLGSAVATATTEFPPVLLGAVGSGADVAVLRAVLPFALLNLGVLFTFSTLYTPTASRFLARGDLPALRHLYWQNAIWVSVLTFPVLAMTTAFAEQFTVVTLGKAYESSAGILTILSVGCYLNAVFGFNGLTIQLLHRIRWIVVANLVTLGVLVAVTFVLAALFGAVGAALAVLATFGVHNLLKQLGLGFGGGVGVVERHHNVVLLAVAALIAALVGVNTVADPPLWLCFVLSGAAWLLLLGATRRLLLLEEVFPEASRFALTRWLVSPAPQRSGARG
jgi:O-antigen/teichoic acid export membrane protein